MSMNCTTVLLSCLLLQAAIAQYLIAAAHVLHVGSKRKWLGRGTHTLPDALRLGGSHHVMHFHTMQTLLVFRLLLQAAIAQFLIAAPHVLHVGSKRKWLGRGTHTLPDALKLGGSD